MKFRDFLKKAIKRSGLLALSWTRYINSNELAIIHGLYRAKKEGNTKKKLAALWDFAASPYAVGDILTWNMIVCVEAINRGVDLVDIVILADPEVPSNRFQNYIISTNYQKYLIEVIPLFYFNPLLNNLSVYKSRIDIEKKIAIDHYSGAETFLKPSEYATDFLKQNGLRSSHVEINEFYLTNGYLPEIKAPKSIISDINIIMKSYDPDTFFVTVHLRQRQNDTATISQGQDHRDADFDIWHEFFKYVEEKYPEVQFMLIGRPIEWNRNIYRCANVTRIKTLGLGLVEEMAFISESDMFMGSNSGPAVMAVFGKRPYLIYQIKENEEVSARLWGVDVGSKTLPISLENQEVYWGDIDEKVLIETFENMYLRIRHHQHDA